MTDAGLGRRDFLRRVGVAAAAASPTVWATARASAAPRAVSADETAVKGLYDTLTEAQRKKVCFDWNHKDPRRGLLRTHVSNNWQINPDIHIASDFFTKKQKQIAHDIYKGLFSPEWYPKLLRQLEDDTGGKPWGAEQSLAIFGEPGTGQFELVMTGRHMTVWADGNCENHVAFGGPIFHGHAATGFYEDKDHPGNVFWHQAQTANKIFTMLDAKQRKAALVNERPPEAEVAFQGPDGKFPGIPVTELAGDQKGVLEKVLESLLEPYREGDRKEAMKCLKAQGGLDACSLAFYKDGDIGDDKLWDNWRLEGPSLVWYFRGEPHVHIWINVADDPSVKLNARG